MRDSATGRQFDFGTTFLRIESAEGDPSEASKIEQPTDKRDRHPADRRLNGRIRMRSPTLDTPVRRTTRSEGSAAVEAGVTKSVSATS
jgi:hypothetical protein